MTGWLLDTNIVSEIRRPRPEVKVLAFVSAQPLRTLFLSVVSFAEIRFGIEMLADPDRRAELQGWLLHRLRPMFESRIVPVDEEVLLKWRLLLEDGRRSGHTYSQPDLLIAASASQHRLTVVSRDTSEYRTAGVPVFNPWTDPPPA